MDIFKQMERGLRGVGHWWMRASLKRKIVIVLAVILLIGGGKTIIEQSGFIMGYDGIVSDIESVDGDLGTGLYTNNETWSLFDAFFYMQSNPTGISCTVQAGVNILSQEEIDTIDEAIEWDSDGDGINDKVTVKQWIVQKVKCKMGVTLATTGDGADSVGTDALTGAITFWIRLQENQFSVFSEENESAAYVLTAYTRDVPYTTGVFQVIPNSGGYQFPLETVEEQPVPQWVIDSGYTQNLRGAKVVRFPISVIKAAPNTLWGHLRTENFATFDIGIDILLFGMWEQVKDIDDWEGPATPGIDFTLIAAVAVIAIAAYFVMKGLGTFLRGLRGR